MTEADIELTDKQRRVLEHMSEVVADPMRTTVRTKRVAEAFGCVSTELSQTVGYLEDIGAIEPYNQNSNWTNWTVNQERAKELLDQ